MSQTREKDHTRREIEQEHRMLGEILGKLVASDEVTRLRPLLGDLRSLLVSHFAREEADDGFYRVVEESGPHLLPRVQSILDEHEAFLAGVDRLIDEVDAALAGPVARIRRGIRKLAGDLEAHEAQESELLSDALYTELGGGS